SRRRHTRFSRDWSSDVCSSDLLENTSITPFHFTINSFSFFLYGRVLHIAGDASALMCCWRRAGRTTIVHPSILTVSMMNTVLDRIRMSGLQGIEQMPANEFAVLWMDERLVAQTNVIRQFFPCVAGDLFTSLAHGLHHPHRLQPTTVNHAGQGIYK